MAYVEENFRTKKAFKEAVESGRKLRLYSPGLGGADGYRNRSPAYVEGPWYPKPHTWYAQAWTDADGFVTKVA